jgi:hypothetical protein
LDLSFGVALGGDGPFARERRQLDAAKLVENEKADPTRDPLPRTEEPEKA